MSPVENTSEEIEQTKLFETQHTGDKKEAGPEQTKELPGSKNEDHIRKQNGLREETQKVAPENNSKTKTADLSEKEKLIIEKLKELFDAVEYKIN